MKKTLALITALLLIGSGAEAKSRRRAPRKSPHLEITAIAVVESAPVRKRHSNGREFEELDVRLEVVRRTPARGDDPDLPVDTAGLVHVVHDLSCGGVWVDVARGQRIELKGEYVHPTGEARDLIHFTHPATGACGRRGGHVGGYLRKVR